MANPLAPVTLTAGTVHTFTLDGDYDAVEVLNGSGDAEVYFRVDRADPGVAADGSFYIPAAVSALEVTVPTAGNVEVRVVSDGTPKVAVRGIGEQ